MKPTTIPEHQFVKDDANSIAFKLEKLEHEAAYDVMKPHRHNYFEIFIFTSGGGHHMIDFHDVPIKTGHIHFVSPGQIHQIKRTPSSGGYVILFSREFFHSKLRDQEVLFNLPFLNNKTADPTVLPPSKQFNWVEGIIQEISLEYAEGQQFKEDIIRDYLNIFLLKCNRWFRDVELKPLSNYEIMTNDLKTLIEKHYKEVHQVQEYASMLNVSPGHLNEAIRAAIGKSPSELIQQRVVLEAKRLLHHSSMTTKEIAYYLNFNDPAYFSRFFKKRTCSSPGEFRNTIREKYNQ